MRRLKTSCMTVSKMAFVADADAFPTPCAGAVDNEHKLVVKIFREILTLQYRPGRKQGGQRAAEGLQCVPYLISGTRGSHQRYANKSSIAVSYAR